MRSIVAPFLMPFLVAVSFSSAVRAQSQSLLDQNLDSILLLMAVNDKGEPALASAKVDGKQSQVYFSSISVSGAEAINEGKAFPLKPADVKTFKFTPVSLAKFNQIMEPILKANPDRIAVIAPDPSQVTVVEKLLISQKVPPSTAKKVAALQPMIFCPEPGLMVSVDDGPDKGKQFTPCSTEFAFVDSIVSQAKQKPDLAKLKPYVVAIPLNNFIRFLGESAKEKIANIRVVPNSQIISIIRKLRDRGVAPGSSLPVDGSKK